MRPRLVRTFARATELGSLTPAEPKSVYPSFIITQAWESPIARFLWISGLFLNLGLVVWVGILIPSLSQIPFGFNAFGAPNETDAIRPIDPASAHQHVDVHGRLHCRFVFLSLGKTASACVHRVDIQYDLRGVIPHGSFVSGDDANINSTLPHASTAPSSAQRCK